MTNRPSLLHVPSPAQGLAPQPTPTPNPNPVPNPVPNPNPNPNPDPNPNPNSNHHWVAWSAKGFGPEPQQLAELTEGPFVPKVVVSYPYPYPYP